MKRIQLFLFGAVLGLFLPGIASADQFRIAIMQDQSGVKTMSKDFEHTLSLLKKAGVTKSFNLA